MNNITIGWMYPNLLNLHGERGSVQMLEKVGREMGLNITVRRIEDFDDEIPFNEIDLLMFLPGEIEVLTRIIPALKNQKDGLDAYLNDGGYLLALGTTGLAFGNKILREDGSELTPLGYLDMEATERKYVWGDDIHFRIEETKQEIIGSQIQMADVRAENPLGTTIYGRGNNGDGTEGARYKNLIYTNCLGPLFVKNPWFCQYILGQICLKKFLKVNGYNDQIAQTSFDETLKFIKNKPTK